MFHFKTKKSSKSSSELIFTNKGKSIKNIGAPHQRVHSRRRAKEKIELLNKSAGNFKENSLWFKKEEAPGEEGRVMRKRKEKNEKQVEEEEKDREDQI